MSEEETLAPSPRERPRPRITQTRQSLGAVGRVASRVKTSGMSMIPTSILGWGKEDEENASVSPWAAEKKAPHQEDDLNSLSEVHNVPLHKNGTRSPRTRESLVSASPVSNSSRQGTMEDVSRKVQRRKTGNLSGRGRKSGIGFGKAGEQNRHRRLKSSSNLDPPSSAPSGDVTSTSSTLDLRKDKSGGSTFNPASLVKGVSKLILRSGGGDAERKPATSSEEDMKGQSAHNTSPVSDEPENDGENQRNLKTRRLSRGFGLYKEKPKDDAAGSKSKLTVTPAKETKIAQNRSKVAVEITRGLAKSISSAARTPLDLVSDKSTSASHQARGSMHSDGKHHEQLDASGRDKEARASRPRTSWFAFGREDTSTDGAKKRGPSKGKAKSKLRARPTLSHPERGAPSGDVKKKNPKGLDKVVDFAVDEYFDSEEDEMEAGANVRSLAEDDFISYQTRHMRKGDRGRNR